METKFGTSAVDKAVTARRHFINLVTACCLALTSTQEERKPVFIGNSQRSVNARGWSFLLAMPTTFWERPR